MIDKILLFSHDYKTANSDYQTMLLFCMFGLQVESWFVLDLCALI